MAKGETMSDTEANWSGPSPLKKRARLERKTFGAWRVASWMALGLLSQACLLNSAPAPPSHPYVLALGTAQDGGLPQIACHRPCCERVRKDPTQARMVTSLLLVDPHSNQRWLLDAGPDLPNQVQLADQIAPRPSSPGRPPLFDGILLTHAHMGHILGLLHLGRESYGAESQPVICTPSVASFLRDEAPWSLLVTAGHIEIQELRPDTMLKLNDRLRVELIQVPHRGEFSDTVAIRIEGPRGAVLYLPDIDKWTRWDRDLAAELARVQLAFLDATFFGPDELPGRSMSEVPHPFVVETMQQLEHLSAQEKSKVRLIHLNHTNPLHDPDSGARGEVQRAGFGRAIQGQPLGLDGTSWD